MWVRALGAHATAGVLFFLKRSSFSILLFALCFGGRSIKSYNAHHFKTINSSHELGSQPFLFFSMFSLLRHRSHFGRLFYLVLLGFFSKFLWTQSRSSDGVPSFTEFRSIFNRPNSHTHKNKQTNKSRKKEQKKIKKRKMRRGLWRRRDADNQYSIEVSVGGVGPASAANPVSIAMST